MEGLNKNQEVNLENNKMEKLQDLAFKFKNGEITEEEKDIFEQIASDYVMKHGMGDYGYYSEGPLHEGVSFMEYTFYNLPNSLCLEGQAGNHQNIFKFSGNVFTAEEKDKRINYLESSHKELE